MSENKGIAGLFVMGDGIPAMNHYANDVPWTPAPLWPFKNEPELRAYVESIVRAVLEDDAREIRENKAFQPVSVCVDKHKTDPMLPAVHTPDGTCWACGGFGESAEMMWWDQFGRRSHLIHNTVECIKAAQIKPEQREHRG